MTANINSETGIRFGVVDARNVPYLYDDICSNGTNESYEHFKREMIKSLAQAIIDTANIGDFRAERHDKQITDIAESVFDSLQESDLIQYDEDCDEYSYTDSDGSIYLLRYLGGAPLIWCIKTSRIVQVNSLCSPCVPNAGDIDSGIISEHSGDITDHADGYVCYAPPADCFESNE